MDNKGSEIDAKRGEEVQSILEKLVTHLLIKKPDEPVSLIDCYASASTKSII